MDEEERVKDDGEDVHLGREEGERTCTAWEGERGRWRWHLVAWEVKGQVGEWERFLLENERVA